MAIDVLTRPPAGPATEVGAGWWMQRLAVDLYHQDRRRRLDELEAWHAGSPPLPGAPAAARDAVKEFQRHSRSNFFALIEEAVRERQRVRGLRTSVDDDATGDGEAWALWEDMNLPVVSADVHRLKARFGVAYALVSPPKDDAPGIPVVTFEDPRWCVASPEPDRPWRLRSGLKVLHDDVEQRTKAFLYRPGRVDVAWVEAKSKDAARFNPATWQWDTELTRVFADPDLMPLVLFENLDGVGEAEPHLDLLRRINFMVLQRLTIAVLQAFKQRAVKGVPVKDDQGNAIDYDNIFSADPAALWLMPATAEIWESGQVDLSGILESVKDDVRTLSAVSRTPLPMLDPTSGNQSAEGAAASREGLVFKVEDRNSRDQQGWAQVVSAAYRWLGRDAGRVSVIWAPPQRASLAERGSALSQAAAAGVPFRTRMIEFGEFDPADVDRMEQEREDDLVFSARVASMTQPPQQEQQQGTGQDATGATSGGQEDQGGSGVGQQGGQAAQGDQRAA